ncbi:hypothetical protein GCM10010954_23890 [Halobacillus andaensis]|uniref:HTH cro/C1-type domain-containing protein n=1 Tax=Halobacillus andaensis TaxID=1176239 RepID=A0A917B534_HALAA|nr:helix-turn-helix transcriptional regulator [Halobacillus andaensis]MBP2006021.1 transcriptional regulator with XRE-family HTH domain [Halobacillus andaensis]GGF24237.1 hypothetical protein GCM10010954_23890 [Halobacillus andaensis]
MTGEQIALARKAKGWTQLNLSMKVPLSRECISKYESGARKIPQDVILLMEELFEKHGLFIKED